MLLIPSFVVFALQASTLTSGLPFRPAFHIRTTDDGNALGWNRLSHLRVSSTCAPDAQCMWPAHSGSSLFRLFRGRRSIARIGPELMLPSLSIAGWDTGQLPTGPFASYGLPWNTKPFDTTFAVRRGPGGFTNKIPGTRLALRPVFVKVYDKEGEEYSVTVSLRPQMSISDALYQASAMFRDKHPKSKINPFLISINSPDDRSEDCGEIVQVGPWPKSPDGVWNVVVKDSKGRLVTVEACFESLMNTFVYPGYIISVKHALVEDRINE
ncbi:uncharacterized protein LOC129585027 isoform X2 [Paramacrobiotus metropolitanus]|uniref:uncharacterized protein LOC129585027 isoform X2 n=1 Tax=Paramacrobiotus metropolitanus TaxID=2943436 RepID=UPI0024458206|nr:uncharacterized protein LOC129585027 isoform X2 [Paramacrobiotus metropolitanus]